MRWIWIDRFTDFVSGQKASAIKNVSLAEEHLHDHFEGYPVMPASLIIEAMAQTSGILVGEARQFKEKVILAKISKAVFHRVVRPGEQLIFDAFISHISEDAAAVTGTVRSRQPDGELHDVAEISLMFSHIDQNMSGKKFPQENFVFTKQFMRLFQNYKMQD